MKYKNNDELQTRREFFKKTVKGVLPMLGIVAFGPSIFMSCSKDKDDGCSECSFKCSSSCEGSATGKPTTGSINGHEYVDLGLSVLWAKNNIGSSSTNDPGERFPFCFPEETDVDKWIKRFEELNLKNGGAICGTDVDIAKKTWGSKWRLPDMAEVKELLLHCDIEWLDNIGFKFTSERNSESIIIPSEEQDANWWNGTIWTGTYIGVDKYIDLKEENPSYDGKHHISYMLDFWNQNGHKGCRLEESWINKGDNGSLGFLLSAIRPVAERKDGNVSTCNGSCMTICSGACAFTCKTECSSTCREACRSCTASCEDGCTSTCGIGCSGGCKKSCSGGCSSTCSGGCKEKCTATCADSCSVGCSTTCSGGCKESCSGGCQTTCKGECKETCTKTCADSCSSDCTSGCSTGCSTTCKGTCSGGCSSNCSGGCKGTCTGSCGSGCSGGCSGCTAACKSSCEYGCVQACSNNCSSSCTGGCDSTCKGTCVTTCTGTCYNTCNDTCYGTCRITCEGWTK